MKQETPAREGEGVCKLGGYSDVHNTTSVRVQFLAQRGIPIIRAALLAPILFGEMAA